jgi:hypothetical protein
LPPSSSCAIYGREPARSWDAYFEVPDPDALAAEFAARGVAFDEPLGDNDDGLRGFIVKDVDGYGLYFGTLRSPHPLTEIKLGFGEYRAPSTRSPFADRAASHYLFPASSTLS